MTRPIMKTRQLSYAKATSNPCPSPTQSGLTTNNVSFNTEGDLIIGPDGQPSIARGITLDVIAMAHATNPNASGTPLVFMLRNLNFIRLNGGGGA